MWRSMQWAAGLFVIGLIALLVILPDPTLTELSTLTNRELIDRLQSSRKDLRKGAARQLLERSKTVVPSLLLAAQSADEELLVKVLQLLEELMLSPDPAVAETAETALEALSGSDDKLRQSMAKRVLNQNIPLRHGRAAGIVQQYRGSIQPAWRTYRPEHEKLEGRRWYPQTHVVVLDEHWQGGDEGLRYVGRLFPDESITLHLARSTPVSETALKQLRTLRAGISLRWEDESCLGILVDQYRAVPGGVGLRLTTIIPDSPADRAGLRAGDILQTFGGKPIVQFSDLLDQARLHLPGEQVEIRVRRGRVPWRFKLPLGSDFRTGICQCQESKL